MVTRKRLPKGSKEGGQFAPDLTGKNPPVGKGKPVTPATMSSSAPVLTQDEYQRQLDALIAKGMMGSSSKVVAAVDDVIARLSPEEWRAVFQYAARMNHDAGYSQGYEVGREDGYVQAREDAVGNVGTLPRFDPQYEDQNDPYMNNVSMEPDPAGEYVLISDVLSAVELPKGAVDTDEDIPL